MYTLIKERPVSDNKTKLKLHRNSTWGHIENFIFKETTRLSILAACQILQSHHKSITHYFTYTEKDGTISLVLCWGSFDCSPDEIKLPSPLKTPEKTADFIVKWLGESAVYPEVAIKPDETIEAGFWIGLGNRFDAHILDTSYQELMLVRPVNNIYKITQS